MRTNKLSWLKLVLSLSVTFMSLQLIIAQKPTIVKGIVKDNSTDEILPLSNIFFQGTLIGGYSDLDGTFHLETIEDVDTLVIKQIGYQDFKYAVKKGEVNEINALMEEDEVLLGEIIVLPGENPAHPIIRNIIKNKKKNNPENFPVYSCETYTRLSAGISNIKDKNERKTILSRIGKNLPSITDSAGNKYIPLFVTEQLSETTHEEGNDDNEVKILSENTNGISVSQDLQIDGYTDALSTATNFYNNKMVLLDKSFISPISTSGFMYYKYYLEDSVKVDDKWEYRIRFKPKRKKDYAFTGELKVLEDSWALTKIDVKMPKNTNVNFLNDFEVGYDFKRVNDSVYFFKKNTIKANFEYSKSESKNKPVIGLEKTTFYNKIKIGVVKNTDSIEVKEADIPRETLALVLEKYRLESSDVKSSEMDQVIDSINNIWWVKQLDKITSMFLTGYYNLGKIEIGPYLDMMKKNKVEDTRLILTGRTAESFSENFFIAAKVGYGTRDKEFKYGGDVHYKFNSQYRRVVGMGYEHNMAGVADNQRIKLIKENMLATGQDNWIAHVINRKENDKVAMRNQAFFYTENELRKGLVSKVRVDYERFFTGEFVPFLANDTEIKYFDNYSATLGFRISFKENTADKFFRRYYLGSKFPIINFEATAGWHTIDSVNREYLKLHMTLKHKFNLGTTHFNYVIEAGQIFGDVPFPMLENHRGNESYGYSRFKFNMLDNLTLASDQYVSIMSEWHLNGLIFNRLPLVRRTNLREVLSAKALYGSLRQEHNNILTLPEGLGSLNEPYVELGAGIENIFKFFRVEAIWRVQPVEMENALDFGVRLGMHITF